MKRTILSAFCIALLFACAPEKAPEPVTRVQWFTNSVWAPEFLNGQVKSIEQHAYWVTEENGEYIQGALITRKERDSIGWSDDFIVYFDSLGLVKKTEWLDDQGEPYAIDEILIENGNYSVEKWIENDTARTYAKFSLNKEGNIARMERFRLPEDTLINSYDFKWDSSGNWIGGQWYNYLGEPGWTHNFECNEKGLVLGSNNFNPEGKTSWHNYSYDENGFMVKWEGMRSDSSMLDIVMKYPKVDEKGNWLELVSIENGEVVGIDVRTIEYY